MTTAPEILKAAAGHMEDRAATYDKPEGERSMAATVSAFRCVTGHSLTEEQGWLFMQVLKAVRSQQGDYRADSYEDGAAYASLAGEAAYRERAQVVEQFTDTHLDLRMDTIARNGNDGEHYAEDMSDPANWRAGDLVECVNGRHQDISTGRVYPIVSLCTDGAPVIEDDAGDVGPWQPEVFRFHSRPSQVNEAEMSGAWIVWNGGECPCDDLSEVEVEYRQGLGTSQGAAEKYRWEHQNNWADIIRYRML